jgi:hypothetical protein
MQKSQEIKKFAKVENGGVHHKKMMGVARNNKLEFQRLPKHHPF